MVPGAKPLAIVGAAIAVTTRLAVLLPDPGLVISVVVTPPVVLGLVPTLLLVTSMVSVQLLLAGMVIPVKLRAVSPLLSVGGVMPTQVPPTV